MSFVTRQSQCAVCLLIAVMFSPERAQAQDDSLVDALQECRLIEESTARLKCFDAIVVDPRPAATSAPGVPATPTPTAAEAAPAAAELGAETLPSARTKKPTSEDTAVTVRVTRCEKDGLKKYLFYLDNGQIWKQVSSKRLYFRECDFEVKIWKDAFGYKMQQVGEKARIRISRVR